MSLTRLILLHALLFMPAFSHSASNSKNECLSLKQLDSKIRYCTDNPVAVNSAKICYVQILESLNSASVELSAIHFDQKNSQQEQVLKSEKKYQDAIDKLTQFIESTKQQTNLIASYPTVMVDSPGISNVSDSLPCYKDSFNQVQKLVSNLDKKIDESLKTLRITIAQKESTHDISEQLDSRSPLAISLDSTTMDKSMRGLNLKGSRAPSSDVSGLKEETK